MVSAPLRSSGRETDNLRYRNISGERKDEKSGRSLQKLREAGRVKRRSVHTVTTHQARPG